MKKVLILLSLTIASSCVVFITGLMRVDKTKYENDFVRIFPSHAADTKSILKILPNRFFLAGMTNTNIYLRDRSGILQINYQLTDTTRIKLKIPFGSEVMLDSPYFFIQNSSTASLSRGYLDSWKIDTVFNNLPRFISVQPILEKSAILKTINTGERQATLIKLSDQRKYVLEKQVDGLLCTDGFLQYSNELNELVYLFRYRNQFICLDTNLNVLRYGKTIDTTSIARISVAELDGKITMSKPPLYVNNGMCLNGKYLFVHSNLMARNERTSDFKNGSVIDVYNISDGSYRFSLYINNYGSRMQDFFVKKSTLVAIFKEFLITYTLPSKYLP